MTKRLFHYDTGIYQIKNLVNNKIYIGQTIELSPRRYNHFRLLKMGKHHNPKLQASFNKHGLSNFEFSVLLYCDIRNLDYFEQLLMDKFKPQYNIRKEAKSNRGHVVTEETKQKIRNSQLGKFISLETRQRMSKALKGLPRNISPELREKMRQRMLGSKLNLGRIHSQEVRNATSKRMKEWWGTHTIIFTPETREKMSNSRKRYIEEYGHKNGNAKVTQEQVIEIRLAHKQGETYTSLSKRYGIGETTASYICRGKLWGWLKEGLDE